MNDVNRKSPANISPEKLSDDFRNMHALNMTDELIQHNVEAIQAAQTAYTATGEIKSAVIWSRVNISINGGKTFEGDGWGGGFPGGGALIGDVYTDDINRLYSDTDHFAIVAAMAYTAVYFLDSDGKQVGHYQAGSVSSVGGAFGGKGSWR